MKHTLNPTGYKFIRCFYEVEDGSYSNKPLKKNITY